MPHFRCGTIRATCSSAQRSRARLSKASAHRWLVLDVSVLRVGVLNPSLSCWLGLYVWTLVIFLETRHGLLVDWTKVCSHANLRS